MDDLNTYALRIRRALNITQRNISMRMQNHFNAELTRAQSYLLQLIANSEPCKISELARKIGVSPSYISSALNKHVENGLVYREYSQNDRRNVFVSLTQAGKDVLKRDMHNYILVLDLYLSHLEANELEVFTHVIEKIASIEELSTKNANPS